MLTNEQRAHDLAIVLVSHAISNPAMVADADVAIKGSNADVKLEIDSLYFDYYAQCLSVMNKHFPA